MAIMIHLKNIYKAFNEKEVLVNINLHIAPGEKVGFIGSNGEGKSTLMKIISGSMAQDKGEMVIAPNATISYLPQERQCSTENTLYNEILSLFSDAFKVEEMLRNIEEDMQKVRADSHEMKKLMKEYGILQGQLEIMELSTIEAKIGKVLNGLGFKHEDFSKITKNFSGGWQARIELAKILLKGPNLLLLDEPTNHLDLEAIEWLEEYLENYSGSFIIVSHDRYLLDKLTEKTIELEKGLITEYDGNYSYYIIEKENRIELQEEKYKDQQKYLEKSQKFIERFRYKATKARQVKSHEKMLDKIEKVEEVRVNRKKISFSFLFDKPSGREVIKAKNLCKSYDDKKILDKVEFLIERGNRIGIVGRNGTGKSTLIKIITGLVKQDKGRIEEGHNVSIAYFSQHQAEVLNKEKTVMEELRDEASLSISDLSLRTILGCFLFVKDDIFKKIDTLSGGEKSRLSLAKIIVKPSNLLLMDEPTNHLDISSVEVLEEALEEYEGTLLFVSHDRYFIDRLADRIFEIEDSSLNIYDGNYSYYMEKKKKQQILVKEQAAVPVVVKKIGKPSVKKQEPSQSKDKILKVIEKDIEKKEIKIKEIEEEMVKPDFYTKPESKEVIDEYGKLQKELEELYGRWEEMAE